MQNIKNNIIQDVIVITDYTCLKDNKICLAGINKNGKSYRLLPYNTHVELQSKNIYLGSELNISGLFTNTKHPHIEDFTVSQLSVVNNTNLSLFKKLLTKSIDNENFNSKISVNDNKSINDIESVNCSLYTISINKDYIIAVQDSFNNKVKLNCFFHDKWINYISIRQHSWYDDVNEKNIVDKIDVLNNKINNAKEIHLRLGITRQIKDDYWLQINGIYFY